MQGEKVFSERKPIFFSSSGELSFRGRKKLPQNPFQICGSSRNALTGDVHVSAVCDVWAAVAAADLCGAAAGQQSPVWAER